MSCYMCDYLDGIFCTQKKKYIKLKENQQNKDDIQPMNGCDKFKRK